MENRTVVPIVFGTDKNYVQPLYVCMASLVKHCTEAYFYHIFILHTDVEDYTEQIFVNGLSRENVRIEFRNVEKQIGAYALREHGYLTRAVYYRLLIPELFREYEKVIYLDVDMLIFHDIAELFEAVQSENDFSLAAAEDLVVRYRAEMPHYVAERLKIDITKPPFYFNSGVLVYNIPNLRKMVSTDTLLKMGESDYRFPDQDILNKVFQGKIQWLDIRWNYSTSYDPYNLVEKYLGIRKQQPFILHYVGGKPWTWKGVERGPYDDLWWEAAKETPYYAAIVGNAVVTMGGGMLENELDKLLFVLLIEKLRGVFGKLPIANGLRKHLYTFYVWLRKKAEGKENRRGQKYGGGYSLPMIPCWV